MIKKPSLDFIVSTTSCCCRKKRCRMYRKEDAFWLPVSLHCSCKQLCSLCACARVLLFIFFLIFTLICSIENILFSLYSIKCFYIYFYFFIVIYWNIFKCCRFYVVSLYFITSFSVFNMFILNYLIFNNSFVIHKCYLRSNIMSRVNYQHRINAKCLLCQTMFVKVFVGGVLIRWWGFNFDSSEGWSFVHSSHL